MSGTSPATQPLVSICMPVRNEAQYLAATLRSLQQQTYQNFELLVFDNQSSDQTTAICEDFAASDPRIRLHRNHFNVGQVNNFNRCLAAANGDFVAIRSGNDLVEPDYLQQTLALLLDNPAMGLAYSRSRVIDRDGNPADLEYPQESFFQTQPGDPVAAGEQVMRCFIHPAPYFGVYRRSLLDRLQPLRHVFGSDKIFICEAALYAPIGCVPATLCTERKHQRQASLRNIFSEEAVYGLPEDSVFTRFEGSTPFTDMIWGFVDMLALASLQEEARAGLCQRALEIFGDHYASRLAGERRYLLALLQDNRPHFLEGKQHPVHRRNRLSLLERIMRMRLVFPADDELAAAGAALSAAV